MVKDMNEYKIHKSHDYTIVCNTIFKNYSLSYKAKGLLLQMLSLPDNWDWSTRGLSAMATDGKESVESGIHELEKAGYLVRSQRRSKEGRLDGYQYDIYESPIADAPMTENPMTENQPQYNILSNKILSNNLLPPQSACAKEDGLTKFTNWVVNSPLREWILVVIKRSGLTINVEDVYAEFYNNDFTVVEAVERSERTEVLRHFQNWLPRYIQKLKENDGQRTQGKANPTARPVQIDEYDFDRGCAKSRTNS